MSSIGLQTCKFQIYLGKTKIRHDPDGPDCVKILGFDANALYLGNYIFEDK